MALKALLALMALMPSSSISATAAAAAIGSDSSCCFKQSAAACPRPPEAALSGTQVVRAVETEAASRLTPDSTP